MDKKRILIVTHELDPYVMESAAADIVRKLAGKAQEKELDIRILMPRFGSINERRHRLHEVVRLSGINIIIEDDDYPLVIKVASLPGARMQVYFLDNEDFFKRKTTYKDEEGNLHDDNAARMVFFCRGVLETVKKFGWAPDIIHCHGWMSSLIPLFLRTAYSKDPIFEHGQILYSVYDNCFEGELLSNFNDKALINRVEAEDLTPYGGATNTELHLGALHYSDAAIVATDNVDTGVMEVLDQKKIPVLGYPGEEYLEAYTSFYSMLIGAEEESESE